MGSHADLTRADLAATFPSFTRNRRRSPSLARKRCRSLRLHLRREGGFVSLQDARRGRRERAASSFVARRGRVRGRRRGGEG